MKNRTETAIADLSGRQNSAERLLSQVARLCALGQLPEAIAVQAFRDAYRNARQDLATRTSEESDAFSAAQVLSEWHQNPEFLGVDGGPAPLSATDSSFKRLCASACESANSDTMLEILLHAGAIARRADSLIASRRELILGDTHPASVARATRLSAEFLSTMTHNLTRSVSESSRFERTVVNSKLSPRSVPSLLAYLSVHGQAFLEDLDSWMSARETTDSGTDVGVGVYLYVRRD